MLRRGRSVVAIAIAIFVLLTWYVVYTRQVVNELQQAAAIQGEMYLITQNAIQDTTTGLDPISFLLPLQEKMRDLGLPMVNINAAGTVVASENVDSAILNDSLKLRTFLRDLDAQHAPLVQRYSVQPDDSTKAPTLGISAIHYGDLPMVRGLQVIPLLQAGAIVMLLAFAFYALKERDRADREKVWAGMAREAAHQLGTPLSSIGGWLELLGEHEGDATSNRAIEAMHQDLMRLDRVSRRFERIGRPPRRDAVDAAALVERLAAYFAARAPKLERQVSVTSERPSTPLMVQGDGVLLEWVLEVLIKNAIDALAGQSGKVVVSAIALPEGNVRVRVADDGPGVPRELRKRIFNAGFTTKEAGWGIGLSLARRIVEENHGGKLILVDTDHGAVFDVILHA